MIQLYNTLTRKKEEFKPIHAKKVGLYTCGPTVYDYPHIGNLRSYLFGDILKRVLKHDGYVVDHVMNITDVGHLTSDEDSGEDKMEKGAKREHKTVWQIADMYANVFKENLKELNILPPTHWVKATDHIKEQIELIERLEAKGFTYTISDGVYFDTSKFPHYPDFAHLNMQAQKEGARVEVNVEKKNPTDFALWKFSPKNEQRQMEWPSPWGKGFPGWHIECSAMSMKYLGETFDIHTGGVDHIPVHHTNEIAQSEAATGKPLAHYWMHNEFLLLSGDKKMAKSAGNFVTLETMIEKGIEPLAYRYFTLSASYRSKLTFSWEALESAQATVQKLRGIVSPMKLGKKGCDTFEKKFFDALNDDLNTPQALAVMWEMIKSTEPDDAKRASINLFDEILGLGLAKLKEKKIPKDILSLKDEHDEARKQKNYQLADETRKELEQKGFPIDDTANGSVFKM